MLAFTRKNLMAIGIGATLAGAPLVAFDYWLNGVVERQGQSDVENLGAACHHFG